nr:helix-turn-helix transcriptional regulator [Rhodococcus sp. USK10]
MPGLRREEVAQLAGVSIEYYTQIERGNVAGVSDDVLHSIARALRLTEEETAHLFDLVRAAGTTTGAARSPRRADRTIPDGVQALIDGMVDSPAVVLNGHLDIVAANPSAARCTRRSSRGRRECRTSSGSSSSTRTPTTCSRSGTPRPMTPWPAAGGGRTLTPVDGRHRARRRTRHAERGIPHPLGRPQR